MDKTVKIKNQDYVLSRDLEILADKVMHNQGMGLDGVRIKYLLVYPNINKFTAGRCSKANALLKVFGECDYVIQMSGDLWDQLDDNTKEILMWHELLHVQPVINQKSGEKDFKLRDHDVQDFFTIIQKYGIDWFGNLKTLFSSVYDIEPEKLDRFSL